VGSLIYASPGFMLIFQQGFEQWCDTTKALTAKDRAMMTSTPLFKKRMTLPLRDFIALANFVG
jgi:hypothetical protein